jgi:hypothetical protein
VSSYRKGPWIGKISYRNRLKTPFALNKAQGHIKKRNNFFGTIMEFYTSAALTVTTS